MAQSLQEQKFGEIRPQITIVGGPSSAPIRAEVVFTEGDKVALVFSDPLEICTILEQQMQALPKPPAPEPPQSPAAPANQPVSPFGNPPSTTGQFPAYQDPFAGELPEAQIAAALGPGPVLSPRTSVTRVFRQLALKDQVFIAPKSPPDFLEYQLIHPPDPRTRSQHLLPELLMSLASNKISGTLNLSSEDKTVEVVLRSGVMLLSSDERQTLIDFGLAAKGQVQLSPNFPDRIPAAKKPRDPRSIVAELTRKQLSRQRSSELELGLASRSELFPVPAPQVSPVMYGLKLDPKEERFLDLILDGSRPLNEIPRVAGMLRPATFRLVYLLIIYKLIAFREESIPDPSADPVLLFTQECQRLIAAGPFEILGVHWSEHPQMIRQRFFKRSERFSAGSKQAKLKPELARQVRKKMEAAAQQLSSIEGRRDARQALGDLDLRSAAHILARHAELASIREDDQTVRLSMEMALELHPSQENRDLFKRLSSKKKDKLQVED